MTINNSENIVKKDLENRNYNVIKNNKIGYPDFSVFNIENKKMFLIY